MPFTSLRRLGLLAVTCTGLSAPALAQSGFTEPSNLPPDSFTGDQFVDNAGCIFVRAGFNGNTTWVPRVTRSREPICGQEPTFDTASATAATDTAPAPTETAQAAESPADTAPAASAPAPRNDRAAAEIDPGAKGAQRTARPQASVPPRIVRSAPPRQDKPVRQAGYSAPTVIPAPQSRVPDARVRSTRESGPVHIARSSWIVPRHVFEARVDGDVTVPPGYQRAWDDDRLNPWRAWQKIDGYRATQRSWTETVPRERIPVGVAVDVDDPTVAYRSSAKSPPAARTHDTAATRYSYVEGSGAFVSTSGAVPGRFVRVGMFTTQDKADSAARHLQGAGLPVRFGTQRHARKAMRVVLVGPYGSDAALRDGLTRTRGAGYVRATAD